MITGRNQNALSARLKVFLVVLVLLTGGEFVLRGPVRALTVGAGFNDLLSPYTQTRAWVQGVDPYSPKSLLRFWPADATQFEFLPKEVADGSILVNRGIPTAYPLTCFFLLSPLTLLSWSAANAVWAALNVGLFALMLWTLVSLAGLGEDQKRACIFLACALGLAPFHTGIATGNISVVSAELAVIAIWTADRKRDIATGILLACAIGLKPPIGLCFLVYYILRRRWRILAVVAVFLIVTAALGALRLQLSGANWVHSYTADNQVLFETGILSDFRPNNPTRFGLVNLQLVLYPIVRTASGANFLAMAIAGLLFVVWLLTLNRNGAVDDLLPLSALAVLSLLPIYHRFYDAALLILPLTWFIAVDPHRRRAVWALGVVVILPFLLPGGSLLETLQDGGHISAVITTRWWWNLIVMPHEVWALFLLYLLLLCEMRAHEFEEPVPKEEAS